MTILSSKIDTRSEEFRANAAALRSAVDALRADVEWVARGGSDEARAKHLARGKLLVRDRVDGLLDPGTPFLELSQLAGWGLYGRDNEVPAAGLVTGIARVQGHESEIVTKYFTVKGESYYPLTMKKHLRTQEIALENIHGFVVISKEIV